MKIATPFALLFLLLACSGAAWAQPAAESPKGAAITDWEWGALWTRDAGAGKSGADPNVLHEGRPTLRVEHTGAKDWSLPAVIGAGHRSALDVQEGDLLELVAWIKLQGEGTAAISFVTYDAAGKVVEWELGQRASGQTSVPSVRAFFHVRSVPVSPR